MLTKYISFLFLSGLSFTDTDNSQASRGREGTFFYSTLPLPPTHEHISFLYDLSYIQLTVRPKFHNFIKALDFHFL